jgi:hypothetical protein
MYLFVDLTAPHPVARLREANDHGSLKVVVAGSGSTEDVAAALGDVGTVGGDGGAEIDVLTLKALAGPAAEDPEWLSSFDGMVAFASSRGWLTEDARALKAHCEWIPLTASS